MVLRSLSVPPLLGLRDLFQVEHRWLTTFSELDHYGARAGESYVGAIGEMTYAPGMERSLTGRRRVVAYLRQDTPGLPSILRALASCNAVVLCYAPGVPAELTAPLVGPLFKVTSQPINLPQLARSASVCVSYAPAGTVTATLLEAVPQMLAPTHLESQLTAARVEQMGAGLVLRDALSERYVASTLHHLFTHSNYKSRAESFAARYRGFDSRHVAETLVDEIEAMASKSRGQRFA